MADLTPARKFEALGPFEIKDELIKLCVQETAQDVAISVPERRPRQSELDRDRRRAKASSCSASSRSPRASACMRPAARRRRHAASERASRRVSRPGSRSTPTCRAPTFLSAMVQFAVKKFGFDPDAFVHELVDSIIGDNYPVPDRMLVHNERIVHEYLQWAMCGKPRPTGKFDLYAVEGGTAAMCYIFKSLKANRLLHPGDTIALGTPIFTPYLEMTAPRGLRPQGRAHRRRRRRTASNTRTRKSRSSRIRRSRRSSSSIPAIRLRMAMSRETIGEDRRIW